MLTDETKTYEALLHLGIATDTQDMSGTVTAEAPVTVTEEEVRDCIASFVGEQQQVPPMYSALKVNGKKLYELAREGIEIERKARTVHFYEISILEVKLPLVRMEVTCSKGTYIRTLCHDIGEKLGCHGCMERLIRTRVGQFDRNGAHTLDEIAAIVGEGRLRRSSCRSMKCLPRCAACDSGRSCEKACGKRKSAETGADPRNRGNCFRRGLRRRRGVPPLSR